MLGKRIINTGGVSCTTDTTQILDGGTTQSTALYRFEDNAFDTSESTGKFGKGAVFNGSSSKIALPAILPTSSTADSSVSFWFKYSGGQSGTGTLFSSFGGNTSQPGYHLGLEAAYTYGGVSYPDGSLYLTGYSMGTGSGVNGTTSYADGKWHHVVVTYDFSTGVLSCFVDNPSSATLSVSYTSRPSTIGPFSQSGDIGYQLHGGPHRYAKCSIDQFRIFNKDLSTSERTTLYNETTTTANTLQVLGDTSCVAAYTFEGNADDLDTLTPQDGAATNVIYDYNGIASSSVTYATGKFGKAAVFNGSNSRIDISNVLSGFTNVYSFSIWAKIDNTNNFSFFSSTTSTAQSTYNNVIRFALHQNGNYYFSFGDIYGARLTGTSPSSWTDNNWHNFVFVSTTTQKLVYVDGSLFDSANSTKAVSSLTNIILGHYGTNYADGLIDQIRIFDKALSPGEINSLYNETTTSAALGTISNPSTVAYYKMQDATDETGSYDGTATSVDFNVQGKYGFAGKFNGSSSKIDTNISTITSNGGSVSLWVKTTTGTQSAFFGGQSPSQNRFYFGVRNNNFWMGAGNTQNSYNVSASNLLDGNWHHVVLTLDGSTAKYYLDGNSTPVDTISYSSAGTITVTPIIGALNATGTIGSYTNGSIDQVRVFNKAISADEVTKLYNEIQCANTIATPESYFNTVLYTGTSSTQSITGVGFQPGLVWLKQRNSSQNHGLFDTVRGANNFLMSNSTSAANTRTTDTLSSFDANGFTLTPYSSDAFINYSGRTMAAWNWKAGSSNVTNNDGTIPSTVSASPESGFSIVNWSATTTGSDTVGHGPLAKPQIIIMKNASSSSTKWFVYSDIFDGSYDFLYLNTTAAKANSSRNVPTATVFDQGNLGGVSAGNNCIAYCFANVDGYQRIGSYVGTAGPGPFVYTGFEPAWLMIKEASNTGNWCIYDNKRDTVNPNSKVLVANSSNAESSYSSGYNVNFHTNGFEIAENASNDLNTSGSTYMFMAIAANPDTTAPTKANSFKAVLYTGNDGGSNNTSQLINNVGLKPDLVWIKNRDYTYNHVLMDSVRGDDLILHSNTTDASASAYGGTLAIEETGFTTGKGDETNKGLSGYNEFVSWNWKALDHDRNLATINNNGSIPSIVSANPAAGFSIVKYTSTGTSGSTVGHGLSSAPKIAIFKCTSTTGNWITSITNVVSNKYLYLNTNSAGGTGGFSIDGTNITLNNTYGDANTSGRTYIAYCWHSVAGYSKIGSYSGGSSGSSNVITVGFKPSFLMVKRTDQGGDAWNMFDIVRGGSDTFDNYLQADTSGAEASYSAREVTFANDGFYWTNAESGTNISGGTYIYMAFK